MFGRTDNFVLKIIKKALGLPTGPSSCCGVSATAAALAVPLTQEQSQSASVPEPAPQEMGECGSEIARTPNTTSESNRCGCSSR